MDIAKAIDMATEGLINDSGHHKQWYLEQVLLALDVNLDTLRAELLSEDYDWETGIPP